MPTVNIKTTLRPEYFDRAPKIRVSLDNVYIYDGEVCDIVDIDQDVEYSEDQETVTLTIELYGKTQEDTVVDKNLQVLKDTLVYIDSVKIEDCDLGENLHKIGYYRHDFNGTGNKITQPWAQCMGCNGQQELVIANPIALWLLENLP